MTVSEVCAAGAVALFVPYPYAVNDHQKHNAAYLGSAGAAMTCDQSQFVTGAWITQLIELSKSRRLLIEMASKARSLARPNAVNELADICQEFMHA
jgi:UDP-N-acetylglucosamine--N-acetylmuramyl-(pentapeptide) pyrophosphoryl-undecaprenol N-acetylglucosamine transferase